jgi:gentisate 1,2-dioxygenase
MTTLAAADLIAAPSLDALYSALHTMHISPGWNKPEPSLWPKPRPSFLPARWSWEQCKAALDAAGRLVGTEQAERRNLILYNPTPGNTYATTSTLVAAYQMLLPGEKARSHRHTPNALRLILEGEGAYSVVDGERLDMHPGDVVLTPHWYWHGHGSVGETPCYWFDGLDVPLVHALGPMFFEPYPSGFQEPEIISVESPLVFRWDKTRAALDRTMPDPEDFFGVRVQLGQPALPTMALYMQRLATSTQTRPFQTTANFIYCVLEGTGSTRIDGEEFAWQRGDVIVAPAWRRQEHRANSDATLFSMTDEPVLKGCGWLRTTAC